jgi:hypothetical protein
MSLQHGRSIMTIKALLHYREIRTAAIRIVRCISNMATTR